MELSNSLTQETKKQQQLLAEYVRTGTVPEGLLANPKRLPHYRRLVYNVIYDTLSSAYPITKTFLGKDDWGNLVESFFKVYPNSYAQIWQMPYGLFDYLNEYPNEFNARFPFLKELIYFEWLEIELYAETDLPVPSKDSTIKNVKLNPHSRIMQLSFPFHKRSVIEAIEKPENSFVILFRNLKNYKIEFIEVTEFIAHVISRLEEYNNDLLYSFTRTGATYNLTDPKTIEKEANKLYSTFLDKGLFLN